MTGDERSLCGGVVEGAAEVEPAVVVAPAAEIVAPSDEGRIVAPSDGGRIVAPSGGGRIVASSENGGSVAAPKGGVRTPVKTDEVGSVAPQLAHVPCASAATWPHRGHFMGVHALCA
jgi:hypothetical protein